MIPNYNERYEADQTPSRTVVERYRKVFREDDHDASIAVIHYRGGEDEFQLGREYCESDDPGDRAVGADVLSQLGWADEVFREESIAILIPMLKDRDVRNWAVFGLGTQIEFDSPELRAALIKALQDVDHEVRGEGLVGLAKRKDPSVVAALPDEWEGDTVSILSLEAAEEVGDPGLLPSLQEFAGELDMEDDQNLARQLNRAMVACTPAAEQD